MLIWIIGVAATVAVAYIFSEMFSRGIDLEMRNFLEFTKKLGKPDKQRSIRTFYDDLFLEAAKNVDAFVGSLEESILDLKEKENEFGASLKIIEKCLMEMQSITTLNTNEGKKCTSESEHIFHELEKIKDSMKNIKNSFSGVGDTLKDVIDTVSRTARNAEELHAVVGETSVCVSEMSNLISDEIHLVDHAKTFTAKASEAAGEGGNVVSKAVSGMNKIVETVKKNAVKISDLGKSSDEIGEIIATIDEIADQTNLLALNAAIEAARAGEQGRGFAVVADEIRKLAERTTKATKEIADTINAMQEEIKAAVSSMEEGTEDVEKGVILTDESGRVLTKIVEAINKTNDIMAKVDVNAKEQNLRSVEIKNSVQRINKLSQDFNVPFDSDSGQDALSEKISLVKTWIESGDTSLQNLTLALKGLKESLDRLRTSHDSLESLEGRMNEILSHDSEKGEILQKRKGERSLHE
ncbi:MAG: methyl-accepting chemotaxis protein [Candidatus Aureabacteria bacterium]|nr:methyl-accepting chemotaxis protein [Candidatus Auribacterota bacterium]